jgi:hypothetical protein
MPIIICSIILIIVTFLIVKYFAGNTLMSISGSGGGKCSNCEYCHRVVSDGVLCGTSERNIFKNRSHISGCLLFKSKR